MFVDVEAECQTPGMAGMGFDPGSINNMVDISPFVASAENITPTSGGADIEGLESYRARLQALPESFSTAGPDEAYRWWILSVNPGIVDARAWMPDLDMEAFASFLAPWGITDAEGFYEAINNYYRESGTGPGNVKATCLMQDGELPSDEILAQIDEALTSRERRPLTDYFHIARPEPVEFSVSVRYWITTYNATSASNILELVEGAVERYITWQRTRLGADIVPDMLHKLIMDCGVKRVEIESPVFTVLRPWEVGQFSGFKEVDYMGLEEA